MRWRSIVGFRCGHLVHEVVDTELVILNMKYMYECFCCFVSIWFHREQSLITCLWSICTTTSSQTWTTFWCVVYSCKTTTKNNGIT